MTSSLTPSNRGGGWKALALELRSRLAAHPGAVALMIAGSMDGPHALALGERLLDLFADAGLKASDKLAAGNQDDPVLHLITEGADVVEVIRHPVFGPGYRCEASLIVYPWTFRRRDAVTVFRGDSDLAPMVGTSTLARVRLNGQDVREVNVGTTGAAGDVTVDLSLDPPVPAEPGDTLTFSARGSTTRL